MQSPIHLHLRKPVVVPRYITQFKCLGASCPDTCCSGWNVFVDHETHKAYMGCDDPALSARFAQHLKEPPTPVQRESSVLHREEESGHCHFLNEGWCDIQSKLGEDWLSNVCSSYPRLHFQLDDTVYQSMSLSCPEAARLALLDRDAFEFEAPTLEIRQDDVQRVTPPWKLNADQMLTIHTLCIQIVRTSDLLLWERLACLGLLCENLGALVKAGDFRELDLVLQGMVQTVESGQLGEVTRMMPVSHAVQATFFRSLWMLGRNAKANTYQQGLQAVVDRAALCENPDSPPDIEAMVESYQRGLSGLDKVLAQGCPLLENAVLNDMLQDLFPFSGVDPMHNFLKLLTRFGLLRWILAHVCVALGDQVTELDLLQATQQFYRKFRHNPNFGNALHESLSKAGWNTLEKAMLILKA